MADTGTPSTTISLETISGQITAAPHNNNYGAIETAFEAHTHDLTTDCVGDTELDAQRVRSIHATKKYALVSGTKTVSQTAGSGSATVTFSSDSDQGNPSFTSTPRIFVSVDDDHYADTYAAISSTTGFSIQVESGGAGPSTIVRWFAYGEVA